MKKIQFLDKKSLQLLAKLDQFCHIHKFTSASGKSGTAQDALFELSDNAGYRLVENGNFLTAIWQRASGRAKNTVLVKEPLTLEQVMDYIVLNGTTAEQNLAAARLRLQQSATVRKDANGRFWPAKSPTHSNPSGGKTAHVSKYKP